MLQVQRFILLLLIFITPSIFAKYINKVRIKRQEDNPLCLIPILKQLCIGPSISGGNSDADGFNLGVNNGANLNFLKNSGIPGTEQTQIGRGVNAELNSKKASIGTSDSILGFFNRGRNVGVEQTSDGGLEFSGGDRTSILDRFNLGSKGKLKLGEGFSSISGSQTKTIIPLLLEEKTDTDFDIRTLRGGTRKRTCIPILNLCSDSGLSAG